MFKNNKSNIGKTKRSTDDLIDSAVAQQNAWLENRRTFARRFLKTLNIFARPSPKKDSDTVVSTVVSDSKNKKRGGVLRAYWFPLLCALFAVCVLIWGLFIRDNSGVTVIMTPSVPEPIVQPVNDTVPDAVVEQPTVPMFDIVRIEPRGTIVVAGRWMADKNISVVINGEIASTGRTDANGEFVYAPRNPLDPGNYTISLIGIDPETKSEDSVFVYISDFGYKNSVSLLMTPDGSTLLQTPTMLVDGDLSVSKIDYLDTGRIVVTGDALPRLRVSVSLDGKYVGFARVSDYRHFGLGADVGELTPGAEYELTVRLHDGDGRTISQITRQFIMPEMTGDDDTYYTVRRGDCLWVIARNFLRRGVLFSIIAERNNIENPDLIFPEQNLKIPTGGENN